MTTIGKKFYEAICVIIIVVVSVITKPFFLLEDWLFGDSGHF